MDAQTFAERLEGLLRGFYDVEEMADGQRLDVTFFEDAGLLTRDKGLVVRIGADEFQLTVVQSR